MISWANKWEHASFSRNNTPIELTRKNLANLHCKFFMQDQNKKTSFAVKKTLSISEHFFKKITQSRLKNTSRGYFMTDVGYCFFYSIPE